MNRFVIADSTLCIGCHTCEATCSETHRQHGLQSMPRLRVMLNEKESAPQLCHHCEDAPCATVCPVNAITRVDGAVQLNESLCVSCKLCGIACPFGAIEFPAAVRWIFRQTPIPRKRHRHRLLRRVSAHCLTGCQVFARSPSNVTFVALMNKVRPACGCARLKPCIWWITPISPASANVSVS